MKYATMRLPKNKLGFKILEGQFKNTIYQYDSLTEAEGLKYKVISTEGKNEINDNNKLIFEDQIRKILSDKLSKI